MKRGNFLINNFADSQNNNYEWLKKYGSWYQKYFQSDYAHSEVSDKGKYIVNELHIDQMNDTMTEKEVKKYL